MGQPREQHTWPARFCAFAFCVAASERRRSDSASTAANLSRSSTTSASASYVDH